jgi:hypothetical protein
LRFKSVSIGAEEPLELLLAPLELSEFFELLAVLGAAELLAVLGVAELLRVLVGARLSEPLTLFIAFAAIASRVRRLFKASSRDFLMSPKRRTTPT